MIAMLNYGFLKEHLHCFPKSGDSWGHSTALPIKDRIRLPISRGFHKHFQIYLPFSMDCYRLLMGSFFSSFDGSPDSV